MNRRETEEGGALGTLKIRPPPLGRFHSNHYIQKRHSELQPLAVNLLDYRQRRITRARQRQATQTQMFSFLEYKNINAHVTSACK